MKIFKPFLIALMIASSYTMDAQTKEIEDVSFPTTMSINNRTTVLNGGGLREKYGFSDEEVEFFDLHIVSDEIHGERGFQIVLEHANTVELQKKCLKICEIGAEMRLLYTTALFNDYVKNDLSLEELETAA